MTWMKEHRSERPAVWDYANPKAEQRIPLRQRLASGPKKSAPAKGKKK